MLIDSSTLTPPRAADCSFVSDALGNTSPGVDVNLFTVARSMLENLDLASRLWRRCSAEIDIASLVVVKRYRPGPDRHDTPQQR